MYKAKAYRQKLLGRLVLTCNKCMLYNNLKTIINKLISSQVLKPGVKQVKGKII